MHQTNMMALAISIHAPPRGATLAALLALLAALLFQFTPLREGRRFLSSAGLRGADFNSRPSARGDRLAGRRTGACAYFNSRPSARGDAAAGRRITRLTIFQFTPLREGRPHAYAYIIM